MIFMSREPFNRNIIDPAEIEADVDDMREQATEQAEDGEMPEDSVLRFMVLTARTSRAHRTALEKLSDADRQRVAVAG